MNLKNLKRTYQMLVQDPFKRWKEASKGAYFIKKAYILAPNNWADPKVMVWWTHLLLHRCRRVRP